MKLTFQSVLEYGIEASAGLLDAGFADYLVPVRMTPASLAMMARVDGVDLDASRVVLNDGEPAGVALIARRGWTSRLAAMSVVPAARGRGLGAAVMRQLFADAQARGERAMELEVIEQNVPAVELYRKLG